MDEDACMARAIALNFEGIAAGGGPFGAMVVGPEGILGEGRNNVVPGRDPTLHAEVVAIRAAWQPRPAQRRSLHQLRAMPDVPGRGMVGAVLGSAVRQWPDRSGGDRL